MLLADAAQIGPFASDADDKCEVETESRGSAPITTSSVIFVLLPIFLRYLILN